MGHIYKDTSSAYLQTLYDVYHTPDNVVSPRGMEVREKIYYQFSVLKPSSDPIQTMSEKRNKVIKSYTEKESEWYKSGSLDVKDAAKISSFWNDIANPDGTVNSNYGYLINIDKSEGNSKFSDERFTPIEWAYNSLINDVHTRQAIVRFNKPDHCFPGNRDFVCTMYGNFHIRDNKLNFVVRMRSTDLHYGLVYDMPYFISIQEDMVERLREHYKDLSIGMFTFSSDSLHIYKRSFKIVEAMLGEK